jgi:hypothetical protein
MWLGLVLTVRKGSGGRIPDVKVTGTKTVLN